MSDHLKRLSQDEKKLILRFLPRDDQISFRVLARHTQHCIEPIVATLVNHVACGKQTEAKVILAGKPELAVECTGVTDYSGRVFPLISAFEYAALVRDIHMLDMIIDSIPYTTAMAGIAGEFLRQFTRVMEEGITYMTAAGELRTESCISLEPLKAAYRAFIVEDNSTYPGKLGRTSRELWEKVGEQQYLLPAHVAQRYCNLDPYFVVYNSEGQVVTANDYSAAQFQRSLAVYTDGQQYKHWFDSKRLQAKETISGTMLRSHINRYCVAKECSWVKAGDEQDDVAVSDLKAVESLDVVITIGLSEIHAKIIKLDHYLKSMVAVQSGQQLTPRM